MRIFTLRIEIPALDRWLDLQDDQQQTEIDALSAHVADSKTKIVGLTEALRTAVQDSKSNT